MSRPVETAHERLVKGRRARVLCRHLAELLPTDCTALDIGAGDGLLTRGLMQARPDARIEAIECLVRGTTHVPVRTYDGTNLPFPDNSCDVALLVDVLHHTHDPMVLLREARRVARHALLIKDHCLAGPGARATLRFMDSVGNRRFGVDIPHNYWSQVVWDAAFDELNLVRDEWRTRLGLYPWWCNWLFGRDLHFVARLCLDNTC